MRTRLDELRPDVFNLYNAALAIIWVIIGGRGTLIGPVLGALVLFYMTSFLGQQSVVNINLFLGLVLIVFVLVVPKGIVPSLIQLWDRRRSRAHDSSFSEKNETTRAVKSQGGFQLRSNVVLETRSLSMHFGGVVAVDRVDFSLRENELRCLIGPNGAGKSTFFQMSNCPVEAYCR